MTKDSGLPAAANYFLKPGYIYVPEKPTVISTVLGSCVTVTLYDTKRRAGGINHFQLPSRSPGERPTARHGDAATVMLIRMMLGEGSKRKHLEAQILGGAFNPEVSSQDVGLENVRMARRVLSKYGIRIVSEDVGGARGRKIVFDTSANEVVVLKVERLRKGDWHPYVDDR
ncbi:MAG: chemotaxis protein CheD [Desulfobacteraceae bacterium]